MAKEGCPIHLVVAKLKTAGPFVLKFGMCSSGALCELMHRLNDMKLAD